MDIESFPLPSPSKQEAEQKIEQETGEKVFEFLKRTQFLEMRKSDEDFSKWIQNLSYEEYSSYITRLNGIIRETPINSRTVDGRDVQISFGIEGDVSYLPPDATDKEAMLQQAFSAIQEVTDPTDQAILAYYILQAVHPYSDGNGRTGRLLYELFSEHGKELDPKRLSLLLDHDMKGYEGTGHGRDIFKDEVLEPKTAYYLINREVAKKMLGEEFLQQYGSIYLASHIGNAYLPPSLEAQLTHKEADLISQIIGENETRHFSFAGICLAVLLEERPELQKYKFTPLPLGKNGAVPEDAGKEVMGIDSEEITKVLSKEDALRLIEIHKEVKREFINSLIDIFQHPEAYIFIVDSEVTRPLKYIFRIESDEKQNS